MSANQAVSDGRSLPDALRFSIYGEELYCSKAVVVLEEYYSALNSPKIGGPISASRGLSIAIETAIANVDVDFLMQLAAALKIRNDPQKRDRWRVADYVFQKVLRETIRNPVTGAKPKSEGITIGELEKLFENRKGTPNVSRIVSELGIKPWVRDRRVKGKWKVSKKGKIDSE